MKIDRISNFESLFLAESTHIFRILHLKHILVLHSNIIKWKFYHFDFHSVGTIHSKLSTDITISAKCSFLIFYPRFIFVGKKLQRDALSMKENIFPFVEISYFRLIFGNRSAKFLFYMFNFLFFGSDSHLWGANFRPS